MEYVKRFWKFGALVAVGAYPVAWIGLRLMWAMIDWLEGDVPFFTMGHEG
jgi:hypothetical protein